MTRWSVRILSYLAAGAVTAAPQPAPAQSGPVSEYQLKAVFLFNFAQFVDWPAAAFADPHAPLVIGVLGDDKFGNTVDATVRGERVNDRPFVVEHYTKVDEIGTCHILFVSQSESSRIDQVISALQGKNILTVSDADDFAQRGGVIQFVTDNNKIRLDINLEAAKAASLTISSKLLRPATIVTPEKH